MFHLSQNSDQKLQFQILKQTILRHSIALTCKFSKSNFTDCYFNKYRLESARVTIAKRVEVRYLPSNGATANVVYHDFDLYFQGHEIWNVSILITVRASEKCSRSTFIEVDIAYRMKPFRMLYSETLTNNFKAKHFLLWIWYNKCAVCCRPQQNCLGSHGRRGVGLVISLVVEDGRHLNVAACYHIND